MTTQQDSVDVERLREALVMCVAEMMRASGRLDIIAGCNEDRRIAAALSATSDFARSALSLPITQRDEQGAKTYADGIADAAKVADDYAVEMRGKSARTRDLLERRTLEAHDYAGRNLATAIRRLSIEQGDQDGNAE